MDYPNYQNYESPQNSGKQLEPAVGPAPIASYENPKPHFNFKKMQTMPRLGGLETVFLPAHDKYHAGHHKTKPKPQKSRIVDPKDTYLCKVSFPQQFHLK